MKYLFWNTHNNESINPILCDLIIENDISVVVLSEYVADIDYLIGLLNNNGKPMKQVTTVGCDRIHVLCGSGVCIDPQLQTNKASIQLINNDIIMCCVHLNSKIYSDNVDRREIEIERIVSDIVNHEKNLNTNNSIIVGDFNINPYDKSCINARFFHGVPIYEETIRGSRIVGGREFGMFYNPMWNFLGDFKEPYGTYYKKTGNAVDTFWNVYDQVIIRPVLRKRFVNNELRIITRVSTESLLNKKKHPKYSISDHLPISFEIREE